MKLVAGIGPAPPPPTLGALNGNRSDSSVECHRVERASDPALVFCGEGSECVTVDMANVEGDEEFALTRAKAILVQTATFGLAANEYDATSNGNFDEVAVMSASNAGGDVYLFDYRDGETSRRIPPSRMPSLEAARAEAIRCAVDLLVDLEPGTDALSGWLVRVSDEKGELVYTVDVLEAEAARKTSD